MDFNFKEKFKPNQNAKEEFLKTLESKGKNKSNIKCAKIEHSRIDYEKNQDDETKFIEKNALLKINFTDEEYEQFLKDLDFDYYSGYGGQELFGIVLFNDNSWLERGEYDGSEWWEYKECPKIPKDCLRE